MTLYSMFLMGSQKSIQIISARKDKTSHDEKKKEEEKQTKQIYKKTPQK